MKRVIFIAIIAVLMIIIKNLSVSIYDLWQKQDLLVSARKELAQQKKQSEELKSKLELTEQSSYVEQEARDKLFMVRSGESIVVLSDETDAGKAKKSIESTKKNWQLWLDLFF